MYFKRIFQMTKGYKVSCVQKKGTAGVFSH